MFCWCICEDVDGDEDDGHADDVIEGEVGADPEIGEDAGGNGFDAGDDAGFDGAKAKTVPTRTRPEKVSTLSRQMVGW